MSSTDSASYHGMDFSVSERSERDPRERGTRQLEVEGYPSHQDRLLEMPNVQDWLDEMKYGMKLDPKSRELKEGMKQLSDDLQICIEVIAEQFSKHSKMITEMNSRYRTAEAALTGCRPATDAVLARRVMRDARYNVAASFMLVFPKVFSEELLNEYDQSGTTVEWENFQSKLTSFHRAHFSSEHDHIQTHSVFEGCDDCQLVYQKSSFNPYANLDDRSPFHLPLERFAAQSKDEENHPSTPDANDRILYGALKLFLPVFIWAFNELKDALLVDKGVLGQSELILEESHGALKGGLGPDLDMNPFIPDRERFLVGTGFEIRKMDEWKKNPTMLPVLDADQKSQNGGSDSSVVDNPTPLIAPTSSVFNHMAGQVSRDPVGGVAESFRASLKRKRAQAPEFGFPPNFEEPSAIRRCMEEKNKTRHLLQREPGKPVLFTAYIAAQSVVREELKIAEVTAIRSVHLLRYNIIRKALSILLDDDLIKLSLLEDSDAQRVCDHYADDANALGRFYAHSLEGLPGAPDDTPMPMTEDQSKTYERDIRKIKEVLYESNAYFADARTELEISIDTYLKVWVRLGQTDSNVDMSADAGILLSWLDQLKPAE
ncbi:hypothetical protein SCHPADRAFT_997080 [Schizopora paradoxa]|uniref:Uncharacterized protein n=1 Tax=Schizopora paradoxa TaxID=27342 RepID=A0A0H2RQ50_9AGAM|nr:hypothetical protein SCHPADRAFT_997080 [Schizopora paradoxa]